MKFLAAILAVLAIGLQLGIAGAGLVVVDVRGSHLLPEVGHIGNAAPAHPELGLDGDQENRQDQGKGLQAFT